MMIQHMDFDSEVNQSNIIHLIKVVSEPLDLDLVVVSTSFGYHQRVQTFEGS